MASPRRIVLIDGYSQIYRAFYAIRNLTNARGEPTNALFGFARFLLRVERDLPHAFGALVLDKGKCTKRLEVLPMVKPIVVAVRLLCAYLLAHKEHRNAGCEKSEAGNNPAARFRPVTVIVQFAVYGGLGSVLGK